MAKKKPPGNVRAIELRQAKFDVEDSRAKIARLKAELEIEEAELKQRELVLAELEKPVPKPTGPIIRVVGRGPSRFFGPGTPGYRDLGRG